MRKLCLIALAFAGAACSSGGGSSGSGSSGSTASSSGSGSGGTTSLAPPVISSFTATPSSLPAGGGTLVLSWTVSAGSGLSIDPGVGDVTGQTQVSVQVGQTTTFTLTATNAEAQATATTEVQVSTTGDVKGTLVDAAGNPAAGIAVYIAGHAPTPSDSSGHFEIDGVTFPYDLILAGTKGDGSQQIEALQGLTTSTPSPVVIWIYPEYLPPEFSASVSGTLHGVDAGGAEGYDVIISNGADVGASASVDPSGSYDLSFVYRGDPTVQVAVGALETLDYADGGRTYLAYGASAPFAIDAGMDLAGIDVELSPVVEQSTPVTSNITPPADRSFYAQVSGELPGLGSLNLIGYSSSTDAVTVVTPQVAGMNLTILGEVDSQEGSALLMRRKLSPANPVALEFLGVPQVISPLAGAQGVNGHTIFSWQVSPSRPQMSAVLGVKPASGVVGPSYYIATAAGSATLPDVSALGITLPAGADYQAQVVASAPTASVLDAIPGYQGLTMFMGANVSLDDYAYSVVRPIAFTTAP